MTARQLPLPEHRSDGRVPGSLLRLRTWTLGQRATLAMRQVRHEAATQFRRAVPGI